MGDSVDLGAIAAALRDGWGVAALLIVASIRGWVTWPSEKRAMQHAINIWQSMALELLALGKTSASIAEKMAKAE